MMAQKRDGWGSTDSIMTALCASVVLCAIAFEIYARVVKVKGPYWNFFSRDFFVQYGLLSLGIFHAWTIRTVQEVAAIAIAAVACMLLLQAAQLSFVRSELQLVAYAMALGSMCVQVFGIAKSVRHSEALLVRLRMARDSVTFAVAVAIPTPFLELSMSINPTLDHLVAGFDDSLGIRLISAARWATAAAPFLQVLLKWVYGCTPVAVAIVFALQRPMVPPVPLTVWLASVVGFGLYFYVPVVGPPFTYPEFYASLWPVEEINAAVAPVAVTDQPRNCMPSLHATWAYLLVFAVHGLGRFVRLATSALAGFTLVAAIEIGNHWFTDLVVALPFAVAMQALASFALPLHAPERRNAIAGGSILSVALLALMAMQPLVFPLSAVFHWAVMLAASAASILLWRQLAGRLVREYGGDASRKILAMRPKNEPT